MTDANHSNTFKCNGDPKCSNAPTHVHKESGGLPELYYCNKCCPLAKCPEAHAHRVL
jgi:hypothetical protein